MSERSKDKVLYEVYTMAAQQTVLLLVTFTANLPTSGSSRSVLLSSDQTDSHVGIDMDSLRREQQLQVIEQQVLYTVHFIPCMVMYVILPDDEINFL